MEPFIGLEIGKSKAFCVRRLTVMMLVFLFLITPLMPVFADDAASSSALTAPAASSDATATSGSNDSSASSVTDATNQSSSDATSSTDTTADGKSSDTNNQKLDSSSTNIQSKTENTSEDSEPIPNAANQSTDKKILPGTEQSLGSLVYDYPVTTPPGRNGLQPDLKLVYNNQAVEDGAIVGAGWSIGIPYIERINRKGSDQLYSQDYFNSSMSGELFLIS